jgi:hypothetical protein
MSSTAHSQFLRYAFLLLVAATLVLVQTKFSIAQIATATIKGRVTDASGAVVPGASVVLRNASTNLPQTAVSNTTGDYVFVNVEPGPYTLSVTKEGFKQISEPLFTLAVNQTTTHDMVLQVGASTQTVTVEATAAGLETSTAELGTVISRKSVDDLPLNGRNFTQLLNLTPGVSTVNVSQNRNNNQFAGNPVGSYSFPSINGQTNRSNLFLLDGMNDQESFSSTYSVPPILDDIQEFKVDSHNDQAQFGGVLGGVINVVTKSGTNSFHGEAWEFLRNSTFDARDPISGINSLHQNQFGANIGGPVILPKYDGRNRTFFFGSYEGTRIHRGDANLSMIPTPAYLNGDFSNAGVQLYNPYSTNSSGTRTPFVCIGNAPAPLIPGTKLQNQTGAKPCSILPSGLIDPSMQKVGQMLYGGLSQHIFGTAAQNYQATLTDILSPDSYNIRLDHRLGSKDTLWGRYSHNHAPYGIPGIFGQVNQNDYTAHQLGVSWNHLFGSSADLTVQFGRNYGFSTNPTFLPASQSQQLIQAGGYVPSFDCSFQKGPRQCYFIGVNFNSGITAFQESSSPAVIADVWEWRGDFTKSVGKHIFKAGADFSTNNFQQTFNSGHLDFDPAQTSSGTSKGTGGFSYASFLLGVPNGVTYRNVYESEYSGWVDGFYFQDQWRITSKVTLNLGARYDMTLLPVYGSNHDANNFIGNFDLHTGNYVLERNAPSCATTNNTPPCIPGGTLPAHVIVSSDGHFFHNTYDNIQPRVGFAYHLLPKTMIRAGYGRFFDNWAAILQMTQNQQGTWPSVGQFITNLNQSQTPPTTFAQDPLQGANTMPLPTPFEQNQWFVDPNLKNPYSDQFNFGVQQQLTSNSTLTVNYVGSRGHRLDVGITGNQALTPDPSGKLLIPAVGCYTSTCTPALVAAQGRFLYPYQVPTHYDVSWGRSWYDGLQISLDGKGHSLTYLLSYTWSKAIDIGADEWFGTGTNGTSVQNSWNINADRGLAGFDVPQLFTGSVVYQLPFGKQQRFRSGNAFLDTVIGDWQVNGIVTLASGTLFNVVSNNAIPGVGAVNGNSERANVLGDPNLGHPTPSQWFNVAAFQNPPTGTYGNFGRNVLRADGRQNFDLSVFRSFPITESKRLEFRAETFNAFNHPQWGVPHASLSSDLKCLTTGTVMAPCTTGSFAPNNLFGVINSMASGYAPRQFQFAIKFYY